MFHRGWCKGKLQNLLFNFQVHKRWIGFEFCCAAGWNVWLLLHVDGIFECNNHSKIRLAFRVAQYIAGRGRRREWPCWSRLQILCTICDQARWRNAYVTNRHDCRFLKHKTGIVCNKEFKCDGYVTTTKELVRHHHIQGRSGYFPQIWTETGLLQRKKLRCIMYVTTSREGWYVTTTRIG